MLPSDAKARKRIPLATGLIDYFPDALAAVAELSMVANEQHNPGQPLGWQREKSSDHDDCLLRHFIERGMKDTDGVRHSAKVAWRALALLQIELEAARDKEVLVTGRHHLPMRDAVVGQVYGGGSIQGKPGPVPTQSAKAYDAHPFDPVAAEAATLNLPSDQDGS